MNITCDMAMDLAELYISDAASDDSAAAVREHLKTCSECRRFYDGYKRSMKNDKKRSARESCCKEPEEEQLCEDMMKISGRLRRRKRLAGMLGSGVVIAGAAMLAVGAAVVIHGRNAAWRRGDGVRHSG